MKLSTFSNTYTETMINLIDTMQKREAIRLSLILQNGHHLQITEERQAIEDLAIARMLVRTYRGVDAMDKL